MQGRIRKTKARRAATGVWFTQAPPEPNPPTDPPKTDPDPSTDPPKDEKQLPQSRVNEIVTAETKKAAEKATADLAAQLGVSIDEAKSIVKAHQDRVEGEKSEAQKAREAADREKAEAEAQKAEAAKEIFSTRADRALVASGADPEDEEGLGRLRRLLDVNPGATMDEIKADVKKVAEKYPALFDSSSTGRPPAPGSDPKTGRRKPNATDDPMKRGQERAAARYARPTDRPKPPGLS